MSHKTHEEISRRHEEFSRLFGGCSGWLYNYLLSLLHNATDVDDALQETGRLCWEKFDRYQPNTEFRAWACRIAYFEAMKVFDRRKRKEDLFDSEEFFDAVSTEAIVMADELDARSDALNHCLQRLPEKDRTLINKRYNQDIPSRELAKEIGRSAQTIYRALKRIHDMLQRCIDRSLAEQ